jgi:hypothetical protein
MKCMTRSEPSIGDKPTKAARWFVKRWDAVERHREGQKGKKEKAKREP